MFFVSMLLILRSGSTFSGFEQVGMRQELLNISLFSDYQAIMGIIEDEKSCQVPCFFIGPGMGTFPQSIDYLSVREKLACQLVQKIHTRLQNRSETPRQISDSSRNHMLTTNQRNSSKNILQI